MEPVLTWVTPDSAVTNNPHLNFFFFFVTNKDLSTKFAKVLKKLKLITDFLQIVILINQEAC